MARAAAGNGTASWYPLRRHEGHPMEINNTELGRLAPVLAREVWPSEARDFTTWLLGSGDRLAEALGIELELTGREHPVGAYSLDLIGKDLTHDAVLMVENQLEGTDHVHLGQLLTYAAGTGAQTIVWIATSFREEHRQALDWMNQQTGQDTRFFGVQLRVVRIGTSLPAPLFEVVAQPNDWQKQVRAAASSARTGGKAELYRQFWEQYLQRVHSEHPEWTRARIPQPDNWISQPSAVPGAVTMANFVAGGRLRHELYIDVGDPEQNRHILGHYQALRYELEQIYGRSLEFEPLPGRRACRIADYQDGGDVSVIERHSEYVDWFLDAGVRLRKALVDIPFPPPLAEKVERRGDGIPSEAVDGR